MTVKTAMQIPAVLHYNSVARTLHWLMALLITGLFALGYFIDALPKSWKYAAVETHKAVGLLVLALLLFRIVWRLTHRPPSSADLGAIIGALSRFGHFVLYLLMIAVPSAGLAYIVLRGWGFDFGLFKIPALIEGSRDVARPYRIFHTYSAYALISVAAFHALAAFWHYFVRKDGVMQRMLSPKN